jgi:DNA-binding GntR family transcriptional regulator
MKRVNTDVAYEYLRERILNGTLPPGRLLRTAALAPEIGVSRTPVRDALRKLEADGLVTIEARLGACVKRMDLVEYQELSELRLALESHAAWKAARHRTEGDLVEIRRALEAMRRLTPRVIAAPERKPLQRELALEDAQFHVAIISAAKNAVLKREILRLHLVNRVLSGPTGLVGAAEEGKDFVARRRLVLASHETIYAAIEKRDAAAAKAAMEEHIQDMIDHALRTIARATPASRARELTPEVLAYSA